MRNCNLDWIRIIAMVGVLTDHFFGAIGGKVLINSGLQIGGVSVEVFFAISALLYGLKWAKENFNSFHPVTFMKKRILRIFLPMWILILAVIPLEWVIVGRFDQLTILMNAIGLGWAKPFGIAGHLWYITMLMILYLCFIGFSYIRLDKAKWVWWVLVFEVLMLGYYYKQDALTTFSKTGPLLFIYFGALMFARGKVIIAWACEHKVLIIGAAFISVAISQYVYQLGWHDTHKAMAVASFIISGFLVFLCLYTFINTKKEMKVVKWLSSCSYEVYLVHMPIISMIVLLTDNPWIIVVAGSILSIILALGLKKLTDGILALLA